MTTFSFYISGAKGLFLHVNVSKKHIKAENKTLPVYFKTYVVMDWMHMLPLLRSMPKKMSSALSFSSLLYFSNIG